MCAITKQHFVIKLLTGVLDLSPYSTKVIKIFAIKVISYFDKSKIKVY